MRWILKSAFRATGLVLIAAVGVFAFGVTRLDKMPRDVLPEFAPPTVEVQTEALGLSAVEVEQLITVPLEQDLLNGTPFLAAIRSRSVPGVSYIEMIFEPGTDLYDARQVVNERLTQAHALPNVSKPPQMLEPESATRRVMMIGLSSKKLSLVELSVLARWTIRPRLMGVAGVANVSIYGQRERQLQVQVDPFRLADEDVTLDQIIRTVGNALWVSPLTFLEASTPGTGGFFDSPTQRLGIQHVLPITTADDLAKVALDRDPEAAARTTDQSVLLGDVATVVEDHQLLIGDAVFSRHTGLMLVIDKQPGTNVVALTSALDAALDNLAPGLSGVVVQPDFFRPARYIEESNHNLLVALVAGAVLLGAALLLLGAGWQGTLVGLVAIALSLAGALAVLSLRGETLDAMVLAGLALAIGVLIDDAVTGVDAVRPHLRRFRARASDDAAREATSAAVLERRVPLVFATLALLVVLIPAFVLEGEMDAFLPPIVLSYAGALVVSSLIALTVTPILATLLGGPPSGSTAIVHALQRRFARALAGSLRRPRWVLGSTAVVLVLAVAVIPVLGREKSLLPVFRDRDVLIQWRAAPGTSLPAMRDATARAARSLEALPGVASVGAHVGRAILSDQIVGSNSGELWVTIRSSADYDGTLTSIERVVDGFRDFEHTVLTYERQRANRILAAGRGVEGKDLTVRLFGEDLDVLRREANRLKHRLATVDGVEDLALALPTVEPTVEIEVDLDRAQQLGVKPGEVRRTAATLLAGIEVGSLFEQQKVFDVVVWGTPAIRDSVTDVTTLPITTPKGIVPLSAVANVRVVDRPSVIEHEGVFRYVDIAANITGRRVGAAAGDVQALLHRVALPLEYHAEVLDIQADRRDARWRFMGAVAAALIGVVLLLQAAFASWRLAFVLTLATLPATAGGVLAALVAGGTLSLGTLVGFFAVFALAARLSVAMVGHYRAAERESPVTARRALVRRVTTDRLPSTLRTLLGTALALVPILVLGPVAGLEIINPTAVVMFGGLITTTLVSLVVIPLLYVRFAPPAQADLETFDFVTAPEAGKITAPAPAAQRTN